VTLTNSGNAPLVISKMTVSTDFRETNTCGTRLAIGQSCTVQVTFNPTAKGAHAGTLEITDTSFAGPQVIHLSGTGD
jgi:Protein of unknown function (DUF1573)